MIILGVEADLLDETEQDDNADEVLKTEEISPVAGEKEEPEGGEEGVESYHHSVEIKERCVGCGEVLITSVPSVYVNCKYNK